MTALLERETHLYEIAACLRASHGALLLVRGPLGCGRSALLNALPALAPEGTQVLRANASHDEQDHAFGVVRQLNLATLVHAVRRDTPLLVLVDDVQWADPQSLGLLTTLARQSHQLRVLVVAAMRDGDARTADVRALASAATRELRLAPLTLAATRRLLERTLGQAEEEFVVACHERSGGNPLVLTSLARPDRLRDRIMACLHTLDPAVLAFGQALTVLGEDLATRLAPTADEAARTLRQLGLPHPVVREAIEATMTTAERDRLHLDAVRLLHRDGSTAEQLAPGLLTVAPQDETWTVEVLREAASTAAPETAAGYLRRALLDVPPDSVDRARLLVELATVERGFDPAAAVRHVFYAAPLLPTARDRADALTRLAPAALVHEPMQDLITEVAAELGGGNLAPRLEARLRYATLDDPAALDAAAHRLTGLGMDTDRELLAVLAYAATVGATTPASEVARLMTHVLDREPATPEHVHTALPLAVLTLVAADRVAPLLGWLDTALATAQGVEQAVIHAERALALVYLGRAREARSLALEVAGSPLAATALPALTALSMVALELRDPELTNRVLAPRRGDHPCFDVCARLLRVSATALTGDFRGALDDVLDCGRRLDRAGWVNPVLFRWQLSAALLHNRLGDREAALALATDARARALAWGAAAGIGRASRVLGHLTPDQPGLDLLRDAVGVLEGSDNLLERAKARLALGTRLRSVGDPGAGEVLRAARGLASEAGVPWLAEQAGGQLAVPPGRPQNRSEARVVELAAGDRTNHEIAELLGITCRAVEKHLTNSFRKLGIRRRTELADALAGGHDNTGVRRGETATPDTRPAS